MKPVKYFHRPNVGTALLLAAGLMVSSSTMAAYTILDGDPTDPQILQVLNLNEGLRTGPSANVPFVEGKATLGPRGRKAALEIIGQAIAAERITIVARPDGTENDALRNQRANTIRQLLIANKVPAAKITVEYSASSVADSEPRVYLSEIRLGAAATAPAAAPQVAVRQAPAPHPISSAESFQMKILELHKAGIISTGEAERMLSTARREVAMQTPAALPGTIDNSSPVRTWKLPKGGTLRDALVAWSQAAGWNPPVWIPADPYDITESVAMRTDLVSAIAEIAAELPSLDFEVSKRKRTITVREAKGR